MTVLRFDGARDSVPLSTNSDLARARMTSMTTLDRTQQKGLEQEEESELPSIRGMQGQNGGQGGDQ